DDGATLAEIGTRFRISQAAIGGWIRSAADNPTAAQTLAASPATAPDIPNIGSPYTVTDATAEAFRVALGSGLRRRRKPSGNYVRHIADRLGISRPALSTHERGDRAMPVDMLLRYGSVYQVSPAVLVAE